MESVAQRCWLVVKSIDLDIWTPEQMDSVQKWGNRRCNLYWEAHLKAGHVPTDHKIESFIRSKYESRRWAKDGPLPSDPSVLDGGASSSAAAVSAPAATTSGSAPPAKKAAPSAIDLLDDPSPAPASAPVKEVKSTVPEAKPAPKASSGGGGIFDLDWHEPTPSSNPASPTTSTGASGGAKGKNDIMSLFASKPPAPAPMQNNAGGFGDFGSFSSAPLNSSTNSGIGGLNSSFGGLDLSSNSTANKPTSNLAGANPWSTTTNTSTNAGSTGASGGGGLFDTQDVWGFGNNTTTSSSSMANKPKDDAFADIWGDFK